MSYWSENETAVEEVCANCAHTLEDHGVDDDICECGHFHLPDEAFCSAGPDRCDPHPFEHETQELCPDLAVLAHGSVFRRREPNDGY